MDSMTEVGQRIRSLEERRSRKQESRISEMILKVGSMISGTGNPWELVRNANLWAALQTY